MSDDRDTSSKTHYICQTYIETKGKPGALKVDKLFEYTNAADAENRAERESLLDSCAGADAYMIIEDTGSGEVSAPTFIARFGNVPDADDY